MTAAIPAMTIACVFFGRIPRGFAARFSTIAGVLCSPLPSAIHHSPRHHSVVPGVCHVLSLPVTIGSRHWLFLANKIHSPFADGQIPRIKNLAHVVCSGALHELDHVRL